MIGRAARAAAPALRLGVLPFGTGAWELETIRHNGFDKAHDIAIDALPMAVPRDAQSALLAGKIDVVIQDWLWVVGQRANGGDWTFAPISSSAGSLVARAGATYKSVADLAGARLGIVSQLDKNWLILQAYAQRLFDTDLDRVTTKVTAAPADLLKKLSAGEIDAMIAFWPFAAKAEARGMKRIVSVDEGVRALGVTGGVPFSGYVFSRSWAENNRPLTEGFLAAAKEARTLLGSSDEAWQHLRPMLDISNDAEFEKVRTAYCNGIIHQSDEAERAAAAQLYRKLAEIGGLDMVGASSEIPRGTFW